jgi:hypothetical protein
MIFPLSMQRQNAAASGAKSHHQIDAEASH